MPSSLAMYSIRLDQFIEIDRPKAELLAPRADGIRNLVRLGRAENEDGPLRRLFQRFQQRVERFARNLVSFVDDEDLVAVARRAVADVFPQFAHFIDAAIRGRIDLDDVGSVAGGDLNAAGTNAAGLDVGPLMQFRQRARMRATVVFPVPRCPRKDVAVRDTIAA